ncbi:MAG: tetratricopeptide repeat protein [Acidobacteriaceae bacterium]
MPDHRLRNARTAALLSVLIAALCSVLPARAQCAAASPAQAQVEQAYAQHNWDEVVRLVEPVSPRSATLDFDYGMALAHLQRWSQARAALLAGAHCRPHEERFPVELAGVAFEQKRYPEAAAWLRRALKLNPKDEYANNFAGTVYYLMGNLPAALHAWNRVGKPYISTLDFDPRLRIRRLLLDRAFAFSPAAVLREPQWETTEARLVGLGIFPTWNIALNARPDGAFDADFHAMELDGLGATPLQAIVSTFSGLPYATIYPSYNDIGRSAMNFDSLLRWDEQKRRAWLSLSAPLRNLPARRWQLFADVRDENWAIRRSFTGNAPVLGSFNMEWQQAGASVTSFTSGRFRWNLDGDLSHRSFRSVVQGSALDAQLVQPGYALQFGGGVQGKPLDISERRFTLTTTASAQVGRLWSSPPHLFEKLQTSALAHWFPQAQGDKWEVSQQLRLGGLFGSAPFDQLFMLGVERDNDLWLRGHVGTRDGRKGSAPLGNRYLLANSDLYRRIYGNGLITVQAGPLFDIGRMGAPLTGLTTGQWLFDTGIEARLTVLGTHVVLTWGRDLRTGSNAFFGTTQ